MTKELRSAARFVYRLVVLWIVDVVSLLITAAVMPGFAIVSLEGNPVLVVAVAAALLLGVTNLLIRPVILLLALPLGLIAVSLVGFFVNTVVLLVVSFLLPGFIIDSVLVAFAGGFVLAVVNTIITTFLTIDDEGSFYETLVERLAKRTPFQGEDDTQRGLVMMEIDGLSYWHLQEALDKGLMPTLSQMIEGEGYVLTRVDCGLPSQTSACQAGILFGDNYDIPAFRWYDKDLGKLMVSGTDAPLINARYATGRGLLRGGSSINNMMDGDAQKSLLTLSNLRAGEEEERKQRARDIYLLMLNPYFFVRTLVLFLGDAALELWQGFKQRIRDEQPRLNRLHRAYPLLRAATTVVMRDVATYLVNLDIIRGTPALYVTWPGYDEVAHHSGPWSKDAFGVLRRYDRVIEQIRDTIAHKAPRAYDLILLSDHGQSFGATFKQRYGVDLKEFIEEHLPRGTRVAQSSGGDDGTISVVAMAAELENVQEQGVGGSVGRAVMGRAQKLLQQGAERRTMPAELSDPAHVTVCGSGNLAQVYFDLYPRKITLTELNETFPGLVDQLVQHEGVGMVVAYGDDGTPLVFGKGGARNLHTAEVMGQDPLPAYGEPELRAAQVRRVADFPHAGDLIVISTVYPDGTVAALEELIGSHGGMGGEQTDAFLFHPGDMDVPPIVNSTEVFPVLNARRNLPLVAHETTGQVQAEPVYAWSPPNLWKGLREVRTWAARAVHALLLQRSAYREIVADPYMTGPALLIAVVAAVVSGLVVGSEAVGMVVSAVGNLFGWVLGGLVLFGAGRLLGGTGSYTATLRGMGFAYIFYLLDVLALVPGLSVVVRIGVGLLTFVAIWMAGVEAQQLRGWRSILLPVVQLLVVGISVSVIALLLSGTGYTIEALLRQFGVMPAVP
ncbi:MAG: alkaline phosphatase family protein [Anaerolineae bacterium]